MAQLSIGVRVIEEKGEGENGEEVIQSKVIALANPLGANPGDTVVWSWEDEATNDMGKDLQVMFREVEPADGSGTELCGPSGPFSEMSRSAAQIGGTISSSARKGSYHYDIFKDSTKLEWLNPLRPGQNFGGLDVPPLPPRG